MYLQTSICVLLKYLGCDACFPNISSRGCICSCIKFGTLADFERLLNMSDPVFRFRLAGLTYSLELL